MWRQFRRDRRGNVAIIFGATLIPIAGAIGAAVDFSRIEGERSALQDAVDAAAIAAVASLSYSNIVRTTAAEDLFRANSVAGLDPPKVVIDGHTATVTAGTTVETAFMGILGIEEVPVAVRAVAIRLKGAAICILALNPTQPGGVDIEGTTRLEAENCAVHSNSTNAEALIADGGASATATSFCARGGYDGTGWSPAPESNCMEVEDPFANVPLPADLACTYRNQQFKNGAHVASPGVFCGGLDVATQAVVDLQPGVYVIRDGPLTLRAHSLVRGENVTFIFYGRNAALDVRSFGSIDIKAPTEGPYANIAFSQHKGSSIGLTSSVEGGGSVRIVGSLHFPSQTLDIRGGADFAAISPYIAMVADKFILRGNAVITVQVDHEEAGFEDTLAHAEGDVRLVE